MLMFLYGLVLDYLGFLIATTVFLAAGYRIMGEKHPGILFVASLPVVVGIWLIMTGLGVQKYNEGSQIIRAVDYILSAIKKELPQKKIIFTMDAPRKDIYSSSVKKSDVIWLNELLREKCLKYGFHFIDLTDFFSKQFKLNGLKFESQYDSHWNEYGHNMAASALYNKMKEVSIVD